MGRMMMCPRVARRVARSLLRDFWALLLVAAAAARTRAEGPRALAQQCFSHRCVFCVVQCNAFAAEAVVAG